MNRDVPISPALALVSGAVLGTGWVAARSVVIPLIRLRIRLERATRTTAIRAGQTSSHPARNVTIPA